MYLEYYCMLLWLFSLVWLQTSNQIYDLAQVMQSCLWTTKNFSTTSYTGLTSIKMHLGHKGYFFTHRRPQQSPIITVKPGYGSLNFSTICSFKGTKPTVGIPNGIGCDFVHSRQIQIYLNFRKPFRFVHWFIELITSTFLAH